MKYQVSGWNRDNKQWVHIGVQGDGQWVAWFPGMESANDVYKPSKLSLITFLENLGWRFKKGDTS